MRPEMVTTGLATRARLDVTRTIGSYPLNTFVMLPHLGFSFRVCQVDAHAVSRLYVLEERGPVVTDLAPLFMRGPATQKKGAGFKR